MASPDSPFKIETSGLKICCLGAGEEVIADLSEVTVYLLTSKFPAGYVGGPTMAMIAASENAR